MQTEVNGYLMFVECNHAVCRRFRAACQEKKESLSISAFKYLRVAMFIWKANIYCTHLYEVRRRVCAHACLLIHTCIWSGRRNFNLWEGGRTEGWERGYLFTPSKKFCSDPKDEHQKLRGGTAHLKAVFSASFYCHSTIPHKISSSSQENSISLFSYTTEVDEDLF